MTQNIFHAQILVDHNKVKSEGKKYEPIPEITSFRDQSGTDRMDEVIEDNFKKIKQDVQNIIAKELERISNDPNLRKLAREEEE